MYQLEYPWLLALLPLPLFAWWLLPPYREETASVRLPFFGEVARAAGLTPAPGAVVPTMNWLQKILAPILWALMVLAIARPQFVEPPIQKVQPARDLLLALDLRSRWTPATFEIRRDRSCRASRRCARWSTISYSVRSGDRIGLIVFGDAPYPQVPFTLDHATVRAMIAEMVPGMAGPRTALGDSIGLAIKMFKASKAPERVLVLLTDGNDTASKMPPDRAADIAKQNGIRIHTVGIGDPNASGEDKLDSGTLQNIAATTGGRYFFGQDQSQLAEIYATLDRITPANHKTLSWRPKRELFHYPLGVAAALLIAYQLLIWLFTGVRRASARAEAVEATP